MGDNEWWGYNSVEGWVVLDRSIPCNRPAIKDDLVFYRCSDWSTFTEVREKWNAPLYRFAPNYLRGLKQEEALQASAELEAHQARWPEVQARLKREREEVEAREKTAHAEEERKRKRAERELKKQLGLSQTS
ncbi:MAG: hypothetical protein ACT4PS_01420 [Betaproteobacteria bacterium]